MKFCWTTLHVKQLDVTLKFYEDLVGLRVNQRFSPREGMEIAFLGDGDTELELLESIYDEDYPDSDQISIGFVVETTLEDQIERLKQFNIPILSEPVQPGPNIRFFYVKDPDGVMVQFVEHIKVK